MKYEVACSDNLGSDWYSLYEYESLEDARSRLPKELFSVITDGRVGYRPNVTAAFFGGNFGYLETDGGIYMWRIQEVE